MPDPSSDIARRAFMNLSRARAVNRDSRSTPRTASTARRATSRIRPRTSTGSPPRAVEAQITRTCKWMAGAAAAALMLGASPGAAARLGMSDAGRTHVRPRAATMTVDHAHAAQLLAALADAQPDQADIARKALSEAIGAGDMGLALRLARTVPAAKLPIDARLLLASEEIRRRHPERAAQWLAQTGDNGDLTFLVPLISGWTSAERGDQAQALGAFDQVTNRSLMGPVEAEERAFMLLKFRRTAEAEALARQAVGRAGVRESRLRQGGAAGVPAGG